MANQSPTPSNARRSVERLSTLCRELLVELGEDPTREGLRDTPSRMAKALLFLTSGIESDPKSFTGVCFAEPFDQIPAMREIPFYSLCEHHMLPFWGTADVAYMPNGKVFGASKLARLVDCFARRPQIQERMTQQITHAILDAGARGAACVIRARHFCMEMRGVQKRGMEFVTSSFEGVMRDDLSIKDETMRLLKV